MCIRDRARAVGHLGTELDAADACAPRRAVFTHGQERAHTTFVARPPGLDALAQPRFLLGQMLFSGEEGYKPTEALSGGETARCLLYTSPSPRDRQKSRMPSSA